MVNLDYRQNNSLATGGADFGSNRFTVNMKCFVLGGVVESSGMFGARVRWFDRTELVI